MQFELIILPKANGDYYDALDWYATKQDYLPEKFASEVEIAISSILQNPESYQQFRKGYRQALMETFPYFIVYSINKKAGIITIVSIFHTSRHPRKKFRK